MPQQRVYLARYGLRACDLVPHVGPFDMDLNAAGKLTASQHGTFLTSKITPGRPLLFFSSPFRRSLTTAHLAADACAATVRVEPGVSEWYTPSLVSKDCYVPPVIGSEEEEDWSFPMNNIDRSYAPAFPTPLFEESEAALLSRCDTVIRRLVELHPTADLVIVSHAPCLLAFALALASATPETASLKPWVLGAVSSFRKGEGTWEWEKELEQYTDHLTGEGELYRR